MKEIRAETSVGLPGGEQGGYLTLSSSVCVFKENLLDPNVHVDARDCYRNKNGSLEKTARWRRALKTQEGQEDEAAGEKSQIWVVPRGCQS